MKLKDEKGSVKKRRKWQAFRPANFSSTGRLPVFKRGPGAEEEGRGSCGERGKVWVANHLGGGLGGYGAGPRWGRWGGGGARGKRSYRVVGRGEG